MPDKAATRTILVIDHDARVNDALRLLLTDAGYKAIAAPDLDAAVHLLSSLKVDLVVTNYMEPAYRRGDRWPVLEMFKHLVDPGTPFIVTTSTACGLTQSAQQIAVADLIEKPFDIGDVLERVAKVMAKR